jgi:hypothetical protein
MCSIWSLKFGESAPYTKWVVDRWKKHLESINCPEISKCFRYNLTHAGHNTHASLDQNGKFVIKKVKK